MVEHPNDIWFSAIDSGRFAFGFAGVPGEGMAGTVATADVETTLFALLDLFTAEIGRTNAKGDKITRMRHLLVERPAEVMAAALPCPAGVLPGWQREEPMPLGHLGARRQADGRFALGAVPPLGRLGKAMLLGLAGLAEKISAGEIRMTPWQSVMLPNIDESALADAVERLEDLGFITRPDRTLAATVTCAGSQGCKSGHTDTKTDALALAAEIDGWGSPVFGIHLTGCSKSCAAPRPAPYTLLGLTPGRYDVFAAPKSPTGERPIGERPIGDGQSAGFGERVGHDLTIEQAAKLLMQRKPTA
jgi:precorrin-3B synthase